MDQYQVADITYDEFDFGDAVILDADRWETDGQDRFIRKVFYENENDPDDDSLVATFCVNFVPGTDKVQEAYTNW
jgi:hypothetical protein